MRKIYSFSLTKLEEKEKSEITKNEGGEQVTVTKKIKEPIKKNYFFARPSRSMQEEVALFQAKKESEYIRNGILSVAQIHKKVFDDNTLLTEAQKTEYQKLRDEWIKIQAEFLEITKKKEEERNDEDKKKIEAATESLSKIYEKMRPFEEIDTAYGNLYNNTAEILARNQAARYLTLMCAHEDIDGKNVPIFGSGTYEDRLKKYDEIEESEDKYLYSLIIRFTFVSNFYYSNKAESQEEYDLLLKIQEANGLIPKIEEEEKKEETK